MNDRIPRSQGDHVLVDVKAKPSGGLRPALTPTPGAVRWQRAGRRPKGDPQIQVSTVSGDCRESRTALATAAVVVPGAKSSTAPIVETFSS
jgi:hypothetical protein